MKKKNILILSSFIFYCVSFYFSCRSSTRIEANLFFTVMLIALSFLSGIPKEFQLKQIFSLALFNGFFSSGYILAWLLLLGKLYDLLPSVLDKSYLFLNVSLSFILYVFVYIRYAIRILFEKSFSTFSPAGMAALIILIVFSFCYEIFALLITFFPI